MNRYTTTSKKESIFDYLNKRYLLALGIIAVIIFISQWLIRNDLSQQINDSAVINLVNQQQILSQNISKYILQITPQNSPIQNQEIREKLQTTLDLLVTFQKDLKNNNLESNSISGSNKNVNVLLKEIELPFQTMVEGCQNIINLLKNNESDFDTFQVEIQQVLQHESDFLKTMKAVISQYNIEIRNKMLSLQKTALTLLFISLLVLVLILFFLFRPAAFYIQKTINQLTESEKKAQQKSNEAVQFFEEKERSVQELRALNFAIDQATLFATTTLHGEVIYISEKLTKFLGYKNSKPAGQFSDILSQNEGEQDYLNQIIKTPRSSIWVGEVPVTTLDKKKCWLELSIVPVNRSGVKQDYLILCNDITIRKETALELEKMSHEKLNEEIRLQKIRSSQVVEAQEKERERIAKDMHDGIGQMLTALKFNLESLNINRPEKLQQKIDRLKSLSSNLIKGVRIATFNLTPPELIDYGIGTALSKLCRELSRLTGQNILFENKNNDSRRYDSIVETNIYRITQEAVNNAIKYADANYILVTLSTSKNILSVKIDDDGKGFDTKNVATTPLSDTSSQMGLAFMQERVEFIFGRLFINSEIGQGTRITINVPINELSKN